MYAATSTSERVCKPFLEKSHRSSLDFGPSSHCACRPDPFIRRSEKEREGAVKKKCPAGIFPNGVSRLSAGRPSPCSSRPDGTGPEEDQAGYSEMSKAARPRAIPYSRPCQQEPRQNLDV